VEDIVSLSIKEIDQTRIEMAENFEILGMSPEEIEKELGFSPLDFKNALGVIPHYNPTNVWKLRDYMEEKIKEQGKTPYPFSILTKNIYYPYDKTW